MKDAWTGIDEDVGIRLSDNTRLSARMWRPSTPPPWPAILEYHPYPKRYTTAHRDEIAHGWFAAAGYASVRVDMRGSGDSEGHCSDEYTEQERLDALEVIGWLAAQPWCTGTVGMYGLSWGAFNALQLAAIAPPALKAVAVAGGTDDRFMEDVHRLGGCLTSEHFGWAVCLLSFLTRPPDPEIVGRRWRSLWKDRLGALEWSFPTWLNHQTRDAFWTTGFPAAAPDGLRVPALVAGGTADVFATSVLRMVRRQPDRVKGIIGPWAHKFPHMGIPGPAIDWLGQCTRWFDRWLKGERNRAEHDPALRAFVTDGFMPDEHSATLRPGRWIAIRSVSEIDAMQTTWTLHADGRLADGRSSGKTVISTDQDVGVQGGEIMPMGWGADLPGDQRVDDAKSVCFDTAPLRRSIDMFGRPALSLRVSCDQTGGFIVARLCDVAPDGKSTRIAIGAINLSLSDDLASIRALEPDRACRVAIPLGALCHRFSNGHRIRIALSTTYWPMVWPSRRPCRVTLHHGGAVFSFGGRPSTSRRWTGFGEADGLAPLESDSLSPEEFRRDVTRDVANGSTSVTLSDASGETRLRPHDLVHWNTTERRYVITDGDPSSATLTIDRALGIRRASFNANTHVCARLTADETRFSWSLDMTARSRGRVVSHRTWSGRTIREL